MGTNNSKTSVAQQYKFIPCSGHISNTGCPRVLHYTLTLRPRLTEFHHLGAAALEIPGPHVNTLGERLLDGDHWAIKGFSPEARLVTLTSSSDSQPIALSYLQRDKKYKVQCPWQQRRTGYGQALKGSTSAQDVALASQICLPWT